MIGICGCSSNLNKHIYVDDKDTNENEVVNSREHSLYNKSDTNINDSNENRYYYRNENKFGSFCENGGGYRNKLDTKAKVLIDSLDELGVNKILYYHNITNGGAGREPEYEPGGFAYLLWKENDLVKNIKLEYYPYLNYQSTKKMETHVQMKPELNFDGEKVFAFYSIHRIDTIYSRPGLRRIKGSFSYGNEHLVYSNFNDTLSCYGLTNFDMSRDSLHLRVKHIKMFNQKK